MVDPVEIVEFAKTANNDFFIFEWRAANQSNLTIQAVSIRNDIGIMMNDTGAYTKWPSFNGAPLSPANLAASINHHEHKLDVIEIITCNSGKCNIWEAPYAQSVSSMLHEPTAVIGYSDNLVDTLPEDLRHAISALPSCNITDKATLDSLTNMPGFGMLRNNRGQIGRFYGNAHISSNTGRTGHIRPFHVHANRTTRASSGPGSLPRSAVDGAGGRMHGLWDAAEDLEHDPFI